MRTFWIFLTFIFSFSEASPLRADEACRRATLQLVYLFKLPKEERDKLLKWASEFNPTAPDASLELTLKFLSDPKDAPSVAAVYPFLVEQLQALTPSRPGKLARNILALIPLRLASQNDQLELADRTTEWIAGLIVQKPSFVSELAAAIEDDSLDLDSVIYWKFLFDAVDSALRTPQLSSDKTDEILWELSLIRRDMFSHYYRRLSLESIALVADVSALKTKVGSYAYVTDESFTSGFSALFWTEDALSEIESAARLRELEAEDAERLEVLKKKAGFIRQRDQARLKLNDRMAELFDRFSPLSQNPVLGSFRNHAAFYNVLDKDRLEAAVGRAQLSVLERHLDKPEKLEAMDDESKRSFSQKLLKQIEANKSVWRRLASWRRRIESFHQRIALQEGIEDVEVWTRELEAIVSKFSEHLENSSADNASFLQAHLDGLMSSDRKELNMELTFFSGETFDYRKSLSRYEWVRAVEDAGFDLSEIPSEWRSAKPEDFDDLSKYFTDSDLTLPIQQIVQLEIERRVWNFGEKPSEDHRKELWQLANLLEKQMGHLTTRLRHQIFSEMEYFVYAKRVYRIFLLQRFFISQIASLPEEARHTLRLLSEHLTQWKIKEREVLLLHGAESLAVMESRRQFIRDIIARGGSFESLPIEHLELWGAARLNVDLPLEKLELER